MFTLQVSVVPNGSTLIAATPLSHAIGAEEAARSISLSSATMCSPRSKCVRSRGDYGSAAASVTATKQRRVLGAVRAFVAAHPEWLADGYRTVRLDVAAIDRGRVDLIHGAI